MPRNVYFQNGLDTEQNLWEDLVVEALAIYGVDTIYVPRKIVKRDLILNEDLKSEFNSAYPIEMYIQSVDGFEGDGDFLSQFGLEIRDQVTFVVSTLRWNQYVGRFGYEQNTAAPLTGDLIFLPMSSSLFEIKFVEREKPFYQIGRVPVYTLTCELFEYESQEMDTGFDNIDNIQTAYSSTYSFRANQLNGQFRYGEDLNITLPDGITGNAEFIRYETIEGSDQLNVTIGPMTFDTSEHRLLEIGSTFQGHDSGAIAVAVEIYDLQDSTDLNFPNQDKASNVEFSEESQNFIDWSETNPFGEPFKYNP